MLPGRDLVDVARRHLGLDHELIAARDDLHDGLAGADHAADGVHAQLVHGAALRGTDLDPVELILGRGDPLVELGDLALGLPQVLENLGAGVLIELDDLELDLADLAARARYVGNELAAVPVQLGLVALQLGIARYGDELLLVELRDARQFLADIADRAVLALLLGSEPTDFLLGLGDTLLQLRSLAVPGGGAGIE